jgi:hypothetical protein
MVARHQLHRSLGQQLLAIGRATFVQHHASERQEVVDRREQTARP